MSRKRRLWSRKVRQVTQEKCDGGGMCKHSTHQKRYAHVVQVIPDSEVVRLALPTVFPTNIRPRKRNLVLKQFAGGK